MPPKMFKIKRAEQVKEEEDNAEGLVVSSYQQQRLETQAQHAEGQQKEEVKRQLAADSGAAGTASSAAAVKKERGEDERRANVSNTFGGASSAGGGKSSAPAYTAVTHGVADALPVNTMDVVLSAPATDTNQYQPLVLNPQAVEMYAAQPLVMSPNGTMSLPPAERGVVKSGTAFLEEGRNELLASYAANKEFFDTHGQGPRAHLNEDSDNPCSAGADDAFMLLQLPRPVRELSSSLALDQMAPGKVGKLTVYKSGRATMTIGGVTLDVSLEPHRQHEGSTSAPAVAEGISQYAVAVDGTELARRGCYQLCWIPRKVVCTPRLEEDE